VRRSKDRKLGISMSELTSMLNIGKEMERKLISVGIKSSEELIDIGAKDAFLRLKQKYPNVCLVHLYTLEGAIHDIEYNRLSEDTKKKLKEFSDFLKR
jgi:DNA transformation protein